MTPEQHEELIELASKNNVILENIQNDLMKIHDAIYGNGKPGLLTRMGTAESKLETIDKCRREDHTALFKYANRNNERIVALEATKNSWVQMVSWFIGGAGIVMAILTYASKG